MADEHSGTAEIPAVVNGIQLVSMPLLTSLARVVVMIAAADRKPEPGMKREHNAYILESIQFAGLRKWLTMG